MIRSLRARHRSMIVTLAVITPVLFVAGLTVRQSFPPMEHSQVQGAASGHRDLEVIREDAVPGELPIRVSWLVASGAGARRAVGFELVGPVKLPDLLVYWDDLPGDEGDLSEGARLLGRIGGRRHVIWEVPVPSDTGRLVFYSTAWKEVTGAVAPPAEWSASP